MARVQKLSSANPVDVQALLTPSTLLHLKLLGDKELIQAWRSAETRVRSALKTKGAKEIGTVLNMPAKRIKRDFQVRRVKQGSVPGYRFIVRHRAVPLISLKGTKQVGPTSGPGYLTPKRRVHATIIKGRRRHHKGAFLQTMKSGHVGIFKRRYYGSTATRLPIDEQYGASPKQILQNRLPMQRDIMQHGLDVWRKRFTHEIDRKFRKKILTKWEFTIG